MKNNGFAFIDHFPTKSPNTSTVLCNKEQVHVRSQILNAPFGAKGGRGDTIQPILCWLPKFSNSCAYIAVMLKQDF
jgi:hypothetical protein